jgi:hypothetical protein
MFESMNAVQVAMVCMVDIANMMIPYHLGSIGYAIIFHCQYYYII